MRDITEYTYKTTSLVRRVQFKITNLQVGDQDILKRVDQAAILYLIQVLSTSPFIYSKYYRICSFKVKYFEYRHSNVLRILDKYS